MTWLFVRSSFNELVRHEEVRGAAGDRASLHRNLKREDAERCGRAAQVVDISWRALTD